MANPAPLLDQIVKGAPAPNTSLNQVAASAFASPPRHSAAVQPQTHSSSAYPSTLSFGNAPTHDANDRLTPLKAPRPHDPISDPTQLLPSSPPQIYLNLLILEASLRSQYLTLRARRRQNTFVLLVLAAWILYFTYCLWLRPREDGGIGGSPYWLVDRFQKVMWGTGILFAVLFWATGQWEHGMRWPRRWIGIANRGLRGYNAKIVVIRGTWLQEIGSWIAFMRPFSGGLWGGETAGSSYHFINMSQEKKNHLSDGRPRHRIIEDGKEYAEEDIAPGGDFIKLLLLPKPFSPDFRENWEMYRTEYWERENERRAELRKRVRARQREIAREEGGWLWWTGWRGWKRARGVKGHVSDVEKSGHYLHHSHSHSLSRSETGRKRRSSMLTRGRDASASRSSSRSTTPTPGLDDRLRPLTSERERRWSTSTTSSTTTRSDSRRKKTGASSTAAPGTAQSARQVPARLSSSGSRPSTPNDSLPWQSKRASGLSFTDNISDHDGETSGFDQGRHTSDIGPPPGPVPKRRKSRDQEGVYPNAPSA